MISYDITWIICHPEPGRIFLWNTEFVYLSVGWIRTGTGCTAGDWCRRVEVWRQQQVFGRNRLVFFFFFLCVQLLYSSTFIILVAEFDSWISTQHSIDNSICCMPAPSQSKTTTRDSWLLCTRTSSVFYGLSSESTICCLYTYSRIKPQIYLNQVVFFLSWCYGNVGACPCTGQCSVALLLCVS